MKKFMTIPLLFGLIGCGNPKHDDTDVYYCQNQYLQELQNVGVGDNLYDIYKDWQFTTTIHVTGEPYESYNRQRVQRHEFVEYNPDTTKWCFEIYIYSNVETGEIQSIYEY